MQYLMRMAAILASTLVLGTTYGRAQVIEPDRALHEFPPQRHPALPDFSMQQRAAIYKAIVATMKERGVAAISLDTQVNIGKKLPDTAILLPPPEDIKAQITATKKYKYAVWNNQVLVVDPSTKTVTDILHDYVLHDYDQSGK